MSRGPSRLHAGEPIGPQRSPILEDQQRIGARGGLDQLQALLRAQDEDCRAEGVGLDAARGQHRYAGEGRRGMSGGRVEDVVVLETLAEMGLVVARRGHAPPVQGRQGNVSVRSAGVLHADGPRIAERLAPQSSRSRRC